MQTLPPLLTAGLRFLTAGALLYLWLLAREREAVRVTRAQLLGAAVVGTLLLAGGNGMVVLAERSVPSGLVALVVASVPLWIVLFRRIVGERIRSSLVIGVAIGMLGVAILVMPRGPGERIDPLALVFVIGAPISWSLGTFMSPRLATPRSPLASTAFQMLAAGVVLLALGVIAGEPAHIDPSRFSTASIAALVYLIVFGSLVGFSAYTWLLQHASLTLVSTYAYVNPVVAVALGALVLSEPITSTTVVGAALIIAAVAFIVSRGR